MQEELGWTKSSLRKCLRPLVENGLRAHDDDPHVPVLANRRGHERPRYATGFQARRLTVFSSPILVQTSKKRISKPLRLVGKDNSFVHWMIVVPAGQNCPTDPGQLVGGGDDHDIACSPGFQSAHPRS